MRLHPSRFEQMTGLTDASLCLVTSYAVVKLFPQADFKSQIWMWCFGLLAFAALLGTVTHGLAMPQKINDRAWMPLNLSLGLALGLFVTGATFDWLGESSARTILPFMLSLGVIFFLITVIFPGTFITFIIYEAIAMLFALGVYGLLFYKGTPHSGWMAAGILVTIIAASVQATGKAGKGIFWYFDNNGTFHLIQIVAMGFLYVGLGIL